MPKPPIQKSREKREWTLNRVTQETSILANEIAANNGTTKVELFRFLVELARDCGLPHLVKMAKKEEGSG